MFPSLSHPNIMLLCIRSEPPAPRGKGQPLKSVRLSNRPPLTRCYALCGTCACNFKLSPSCFLIAHPITIFVLAIYWAKSLYYSCGCNFLTITPPYPPPPTPSSSVSLARLHPPFSTIDSLSLSCLASFTIRYARHCKACGLLRPLLSLSCGAGLEYRLYCNVLIALK